MSGYLLPPRLKYIASLVPKGSLVADVGTDHAHLPIYLIENRITNRVIASDIVDGPIMSAKKNISAHGLDGKIEVIKSDGIVKVFPLSPETVIIAGMGGETIRDIISACEYSKVAAPLFLLQPMTHAEVLRKYLIENGFSIVSESVVREQHRYYVIISAQFKELQQHYFEFKSENADLIYELGGIVPASSNDAESYLLWKKQTLERTLNGLLKSASQNEKITDVRALISEIDQRLSV